MFGLTFANPGNHRGLSRHLWRDIPLEFFSNYMLEEGLFDIDDFKGNLPTAKYTATQETSGTFAMTVANGEGGVVLADSGASTNDQGINVQEAEWLGWEAGSLLIFEARVMPAAIGTAGNIFIGLAIADTTIVASDAMTTDDYIGFHGLASNSLTFARRKDGGTAQTSSAGVGTLVASTWMRLGFRVNEDGVATPYVNGVEMESYKLTGTSAMPTDILGRSLVCQSNGTTRPTLAMDYWAVAKKKKYTA